MRQEEENRRLKQMVAELSPDRMMLQDVLLKTPLMPAQRARPNIKFIRDQITLTIFVTSV